MSALKALRYNGRVWTHPLWHWDAQEKMMADLFGHLPVSKQIEEFEKLPVEYGFQFSDGVFESIWGYPSKIPD